MKMQRSFFRILFIIIVGLVVTTTAKPACSTTDIKAVGSKALIDRSISGVCYDDLNKNGRVDENESGIPGIEVTLKKVFLFVMINDLETVTTGPDGSFDFKNLSRGIYIIESTVSEGLGVTTRNPYLFSLGIFRSEKSIDFGIAGYQAPDTPPPPPPQPGPADQNQIIATFSAQPPVISEGGTSTLSWTIENADTIKINNDIGAVEATGELLVSPQQTTLFTLTASNDKKSVSKIVSIVVKPATSPAPNVSPPAGGTGPGISLPPLPTTGSISGKIVNANDEPLNNISVYAYDEDEQIIAQAATDVIGDYILDELDPGSYRLLFMPSAEHDNSYIHQWYGNATAHADATPLKIAAGDVRSDINAILNSGGNITGMVIDAKSAPVADILIKVTLLINDTHKPLDDFCAFASTDETGNYKTTGLLEGDYTVAFIDTNIESLPDYSFQYYNDKIIFHERDLVSVSVGEVTHDIDAQLDNGTSINGSVSDKDGHPVPNINIEVYDEDRIACGFGDSGSNGAYRTSGVSEGNYAIHFNACDTNYISQWYMDQPTADAADTIYLPLAKTTTIDAMLEPGGRISGYVTDLTNAPLDNIDICISNQTEPDDCIMNAQTDRGGYYRTCALAAGKYFIRFSDSHGSYITRKKIEVTVSEGSILAFNIELAAKPTLVYPVDLFRQQ